LAHVTLAQKSAQAGSHYSAVFRVPHGCDGSATKAITVFLPASIDDAIATPKRGWTLDTKTEKRGNATRTTQIGWSGGSLPSTQHDEFIAQMTLPETTGKLYFRVLQICEKGQSDWAEIAAADAAAPKTPAPVLEVTRAFVAGKIRIEHPWARATVPAQSTGGAFLTIDNGGGADKLMSVSSNVADATELHSMTMHGNVMSMQKMGALEIPAGKSVELGPDSFHIMLIKLKAPLKEGSTFPLKLKFEKAGEVTVDVNVEAITSNGTPAADEHMDMKM
ncbi:MAG TPA: copper chaperone PCu(A)C, partial [Rhodocyclaceae bacterium]|nr:copper chaperone PCu(A)C [Rhodocyclaceae bacterium]